MSGVCKMDDTERNKELSSNIYLNYRETAKLQGRYGLYSFMSLVVLVFVVINDVKMHEPKMSIMQTTFYCLENTKREIELLKKNIVTVSTLKETMASSGGFMADLSLKVSLDWMGILESNMEKAENWKNLTVKWLEITKSYTGLSINQELNSLEKIPKLMSYIPEKKTLLLQQLNTWLIKLGIQEEELIKLESKINPSPIEVPIVKLYLAHKFTIVIVPLVVLFMFVYWFRISNKANYLFYVYRELLSRRMDFNGDINKIVLQLKVISPFEDGAVKSTRFDTPLFETLKMIYVLSPVVLVLLLDASVYLRISNNYLPIERVQYVLLSHFAFIALFLYVLYRNKIITCVLFDKIKIYLSKDRELIFLDKLWIKGKYARVSIYAGVFIVQVLGIAGMLIFFLSAYSAIEHYVRSMSELSVMDDVMIYIIISSFLTSLIILYFGFYVAYNWLKAKSHRGAKMLVFSSVALMSGLALVALRIYFLYMA